VFIIQSRTGARVTVFFVCLLGWLLCTGATAQAERGSFRLLRCRPSRLLCTGEAAQAQPQPKDPEDKTAEFKSLLKERRDVLEMAEAVATAQYKSGVIPFSVLAQAERDLLKVTLDIEEDSAKRQIAFDKLQKNAERALQITEANYKAGLVTQLEVLQAKALLLEFRAELLRDEQKARPSK